MSGAHQAHIVNRAIVIHPGQPLSQERILQTQRNLYDLGIFNEVQTPSRTRGDEAHKDVLLQLTEAKRWTVNYAAASRRRQIERLAGRLGAGRNRRQPARHPGRHAHQPGWRDQSLIFRSHFGLLQKRASLTLNSRWFDLPNWRFALTAFTTKRAT